jgi:hypothetical protein
MMVHDFMFPFMILLNSQNSEADGKGIILPESEASNNNPILNKEINLEKLSD